MITIDLENLLFSRAFLELKYAFAGKTVMKNINNKYAIGELAFLDLDTYHEVERIYAYTLKQKANYENVVVLGIGGSALGTKAILQALKGKYYNELSREQRGGNPKIYVLDNVDPTEVKNLLDVIDLKQTLFVVISKSGSTLETIAQYKFFKSLLLSQNLDYKKHFVVIAGESSRLKQDSLAHGLEVFDIPEKIGGRFSVFTNVGLLPLAFAGIKIEGLLAGITKMKAQLLQDNIFTNQALLTSIIQYHSYMELGKNITVFFPYVSNFSLLGDWYRQMIGESLGKGGIGVTVANSIGVTDQHSQLQLYYDGPNDKLIIFLEVAEFGNDYTIIDKPRFGFGDLMHIEKYGTQQSISKYNKINYTMTLDKITEETLGELIVFFEMQTAILGELYHFDPFDQPGVEIGKKITKEKIKENIGKISLLENIYDE